MGPDILTMIYQLLSKEEIVQLKDELQHDLPGSAKVGHVFRIFIVKSV